MKPAPFLLCFLSVFGWRAPSQAQPYALTASTQMIVVTTPDWSAIGGRLQRYERATIHEKWHPVGKPFSIVVGKSGLGWGVGVTPAEDAGRDATDPIKREGDGKSPAGIFTLGTAFGYAPQPLSGLRMPYLNLTTSTECVDDVHSKYYNRVVDRSSVAPDWNSSEHMRDAGESYRWGIVVDHNRIVRRRDGKSSEPGAGSCIFLHIWHSRDQGTAGCTAMPQSELQTLLRWLDPVRNPLLVQLPQPTYERLMTRWMLPQLTSLPSR